MPPKPHCFRFFKSSVFLQRRRRLRLEPLESRLLLYSMSGATWGDSNLTFSFAPDGTPWEGDASVLFAQLDAMAPRAIWQREFARALQTWANHSSLNFHESRDEGTWGGKQGKIRLGAIPLDDITAKAILPTPSHGGGDITLDANAKFRIGGIGDLYTVLLHEAGHALGLNHSRDPGSVMIVAIGRPRGLGADDIAGIQALYGPRQHDVFDAGAENNDFVSATVLRCRIPRARHTRRI